MIINNLYSDKLIIYLIYFLISTDTKCQHWPIYKIHLKSILFMHDCYATDSHTWSALVLPAPETNTKSVNVCTLHYRNVDQRSAQQRNCSCLHSGRAEATKLINSLTKICKHLYVNTKLQLLIFTDDKKAQRVACNHIWVTRTALTLSN